MLHDATMVPTEFSQLATPVGAHTGATATCSCNEVSNEVRRQLTELATPKDATPGSEPGANCGVTFCGNNVVGASNSRSCGKQAHQQQELWQAAAAGAAVGVGTATTSSTTYQTQNQDLLSSGTAIIWQQVLPAQRFSLTHSLSLPHFA